MANQTILVIEPNAIDLKMTAAALRVEGWRVQVASTGEQALMALRTLRPDLVLVSLKLPGITGFEFAAEIRRSPHTRAIRVIGISSSAADERAAREAGCDGFLAKPIDIRDMGRRLRGCLNPQAVPDPPPASEPVSEPPLPAEVFAIPGESAEIPLPEPIAQALRGKRVALIGFAEKEAERICAALERVQALPRLLASAEPPDSEIVASCRLILVHIRSETADGPDFASRVSLAPAQAMVLVGTREDLLAVDHAVQSRARELLVDGWQPEEVILRLSLALTREPPQQREEPAPRPRAARPESAEVLVVDDDLDIRILVHHALTRSGMGCLIAANGAEALEMLKRHRPSAIILDVNMPVLDGFEVLTRIREQGLTVPVLMLTARQQEKDILLGFDLGADDYVVKPFSPPELVARLKRLVKG